MIVRKNDTGALLKFQLRQGYIPVNITGATVTLVGTRYDGSSFGGACVLSDPTNGKFSYSLTALDTSIAGIHVFSILVTLGDTVARLPRYGNERFEVLPLRVLN